jgi:hypothetical protein
MRLRDFCIAIAFVFSAAGNGNAQRVDLDALMDSLQSSGDLTSLRKREIDLAKPPAASDAEAMLERGAVLLRIFQVSTATKDANMAREVFQKAARKLPTDARPYYGLGLAYYSVTRGVTGGFALTQAAAEAIGSDPRSRAGRAFVRALELDPALDGAAVQLARLAVEKHDRELLLASRQALRRLIELGHTDPDVAGALSRIEASLGDVDAAADAATLAINSNAGDPSVNQLIRATALLRKSETLSAGAAAYFAGIDQLTEAAADAYFRDILPIATPSELAEWKGSSLEQRKAWLRTFWDMRAAMGGVTVAERLGEHYTRVAEAMNRYRRLGRRGAPPAGALLANEHTDDQLPFDDRGTIYVRHGKPIEIVRTSSPDLRSNETWVYRAPDASQILYNFVVLRDGTDYRMVDDLFLAMDASAGSFPFDAIIDLLKDRGPYDARYFQLATRLSSVRHQAWAASAFNALGATGASASMEAGSNAALSEIGATRQLIAQTNRAAGREAVQTDSDRPDFDADLPFYYDVFSMKAGRGTAVTAAVAVPGSSLQPVKIGSAYVYSVELSLILIDTARNTISRSDSTLSLRSSRVLGERDFLRLYTDVQTDAAAQVLHRIVLKDLARTGRGQLYGGNTRIRSFGNTALEMSDIVIAEPDAGTWQRGEARLGLVPPRQFLEGAPVRLFYELYNLPAATSYRTEIAISPIERVGRLKRLLGASDGTVRFSFDGIASPGADGILQESRKVSTEIRPGRYRVSVKVTNLANNQSTTGETKFVVLDRK